MHSKTRKKQTRRKIPTREIEDEEFAWPYQISLDLRKAPQPKVAFLSGIPRRYYPEDSGTSRFGIQYSINCKPGNVPNPNFYPPPLGLRKPVSKKGYGMGGLSASRFLKDPKKMAPHPAISKKKIKKKDAKKPGTKESDKVDIDVSALKKQCVNAKYCFGSHLSVPRFGVEERYKPVGVGYYNLLGKCCPDMPSDDGFGRGPRYLIQSTNTYCNYENYDECSECGLELRTVDYYRSKYKVIFPTSEAKGPPNFIALCRKCYCAALRGKHKVWRKNYVEWLFTKTRHCQYVHEHHKLPVLVHKTTCNLIRSLQRKEVVMKKFYKDACEKVVKENPN